LGGDFEAETDEVVDSDDDADANSSSSSPNPTILSRSSLSPQAQPILENSISPIPSTLQSNNLLPPTPPAAPKTAASQTSFSLTPPSDQKQLQSDLDEATQLIIDAESENKSLNEIIHKRVQENAELHERISQLEKLASSEIGKVQKVRKTRIRATTKLTN